MNFETLFNVEKVTILNNYPKIDAYWYSSKDKDFVNDTNYTNQIMYIAKENIIVQKYEDIMSGKEPTSYYEYLKVGFDDGIKMILNGANYKKATYHEVLYKKSLVKFFIDIDAKEEYFINNIGEENNFIENVIFGYFMKQLILFFKNKFQIVITEKDFVLQISTKKEIYILSKIHKEDNNEPNSKVQKIEKTKYKKFSAHLSIDNIEVSNEMMEKLLMMFLIYLKSKHESRQTKEHYLLYVQNLMDKTLTIDIKEFKQMRTLFSTKCDEYRPLNYCNMIIEDANLLGYTIEEFDKNNKELMESRLKKCLLTYKEDKTYYRITSTKKGNEYKDKISNLNNAYFKVTGARKNQICDGELEIVKSSFDIKYQTPTEIKLDNTNQRKIYYLNNINRYYSCFAKDLNFQVHIDNLKIVDAGDYTFVSIKKGAPCCIKYAIQKKDHVPRKETSFTFCIKTNQFYQTCFSQTCKSKRKLILQPQ